MDTLKDKLRIDRAENEEHVGSVRAHDEAINRLHEDIVKIREDTSQEILEESTLLKTELLDLKKFFEQQKEFVTQYSSTIDFLRAKLKDQKIETDGYYNELTRKIEDYKLDILKAQTNQGKASEGYEQVSNQLQDLENRITGSRQT